MSELKPESIIDEPSFKDRHSFLIFITASIIIASVIVVISMTMYNGSGAAQLDLSRPGYVSVRSQVTANESDFKTFSSAGLISKDIIEDFKSIYNEQTQKIKTIDAFGSDPLSADALGISAPAEQ